MEEKKKGMSPVLIILIVLIGGCLLSAGLWYGINYLNRDAEEPGDVEESSNLTEDYIDGEYHTYIVYSSKDSENYKKVDYSKSFVLKPYDESIEEIVISSDNVITLKGIEEVKDKSLKVDEKIVSALIDFDCSDAISIYYLTESKKLYYSDFDALNNPDAFKAYLIDSNVEKLGYSRLNRATTCGSGNTITYKKVDDDNLYEVRGYYNWDTKKVVVSSKDMKYENYDEVLYPSNDYSNVLVLYKNYPEKTIDEKSVILKNSEGNDLYVKGAFASVEQLQLENKNDMYFLGEDDYIYYYPHGYSSKNVKATKYNDSKVKKISSSKTTNGDGSVPLTIEYVNGKTEKIDAVGFSSAILDL